jgi:PIN domain nuclease of toxin-antitoxin system
VADLPDLHRDPFDRILVAQARVENLAIITADRAVGSYEVTVIDPAS